LREADVAEIQRAMGYFVNLPAHRYRLHFQCEDHAEARDLEEAKILEAEHRDASGPWVLCLGHYRYFATITKISSGLRPSTASISENHRTAVPVRS